MKQMRENTKIILWVVVVAFVITIFAVWGLDLQAPTGGGGGQQALVGKVNDTPITPQMFQSVYGQLAQQYRDNSPDGSLSYSQQEMLRDQAWESIVNNVLTDQKIKELGITVTDQEILSYLRDAPPPEVRQYFVDESGNFDYAAYMAAFNNPEADWTAVENLARQRIPLLKLNQFLMAQVHVSRDELQRAFEEENTGMVVKYVEFPIASEDIDNAEPDDDDIQAYYDEHTEEFSHDEMAVVRYARIPIEPSAQDRDDIDFTIGVIRQQIVEQGIEFSDQAKTYSEAQTSQVGGDTGFITEGQRPAAVMAAVADMEPGDLSEPIWTNDGVYLVELVEKKEEDGETRYRLNEIFLHLSAGSATTDSLFALAEDIQKAAAENDGSLESAAATRNITVQTSAPFSSGMRIEGLGFVPSISRFAFSHDPGEISDVLGDDDNYYVCELVEHIPAGPRPLEDVRDDVVRTIVQERRNLAAERKASAFRLSLRSGGGQTFESAAETYGYNVQTTDTFTVRQPVADQPPRSPFHYTAFNLNVDDDSYAVESYGSYFIIRLLYRDEMDMQAFEEQADAIRSRLYQTKAQQYIAYWYDSLRENSTIEDYRTSF
jgi:peptidyl-prolyl cis-trans isomerase D